MYHLLLLYLLSIYISPGLVILHTEPFCTFDHLCPSLNLFQLPCKFLAMEGSGPSKLTRTDEFTPNIPNLLQCRLLRIKMPASAVISEHSDKQAADSSWRASAVLLKLKQQEHTQSGLPISSSSTSSRWEMGSPSSVWQSHCRCRNCSAGPTGRKTPGVWSFLKHRAGMSGCCCLHHLSPRLLWCLIHNINTLQKGLIFPPLQSKGNQPSLAKQK